MITRVLGSEGVTAHLSIYGHRIRDCGRDLELVRAIHVIICIEIGLANKWQSVCKKISATMTTGSDSSTILVAEDQEHVREAIAMLLRGHGYSVVLCAS